MFYIYLAFHICERPSVLGVAHLHVIRICLFWCELTFVVVARNELPTRSAWVWHVASVWHIWERVSYCPWFHFRDDHFICTWNTGDFFPNTQGIFIHMRKEAGAGEQGREKSKGQTEVAGRKGPLRDWPRGNRGICLDTVFKWQFPKTKMGSYLGTSLHVSHKASHRVWTCQRRKDEDKFPWGDDQFPYSLFWGTDQGCLGI